ncbi:MAG TPA: AIR synthase-related protein [Spirochaetia bacterium]|nr:AIR synthase-related protein [Spirochaetales bacterium]HRZ88539.1 AIR synthase-related protein [Spirochaetia bacterium]
MRIEIFFTDPALDGPGSGISEKLSRALGRDLRVRVVEVILPGVPVPRPVAEEAFSDPVVQRVTLDEPAAALLPGWSALVETAWRPGVTDTLALTAREALAICGGPPESESAGLRTARQYLLYGDAGRPEAEEAARLLHNPLIQEARILTVEDWAAGLRPPASYPGVSVHDRPDWETFDLESLSDTELEALSRDRLLALTLPELRALRDHFADPRTVEARRSAGLPAEATDVELEMVAQTWSEHCKHKIFNAEIEYSETDGAGRPSGAPETIRSLFKTYIRGLTEELAPSKDFLRSVFTDNAGVVQFRPGWALCVKAETHNSPSALDPYGGAITGIVGVNRDILGTGMGAKPIFNTDVLCFAPPDTPEGEVPEGLLHPREVLEGVHKGIVDGGNQSGIPTVAGTFLFDESFLGKPLVFCGTGGILPETVNGKPAWEKTVSPGDRAVMLGGRIGKDGIHGATFSSLALDEGSPASAVQIGDPIIQRRMTDFLLEARDRGLYAGITDNGAGGLSSSLGEMAQSSGGVRIDLDACPLKYPGLSPWEILVSESQERMSLAVPPDRIDDFLALAARRGVEATVVGEFTDSGNVEIRSGGRTAGLLSLDFLHDGLPPLRLSARWSPVSLPSDPLPAREDWTETLYRILAEPNSASKEPWVREYDHEVQGRSVEKPFTGVHRDAPSDGAVLKPRYDDGAGITVTHGICPRLSDYDAGLMAACAVDEAYRAHVALGGDPDRAAALDNFCWPDPLPSPGNPDAERKLAQLVRACRGLADACRAYGLPLVSGKDSMKNDAVAGGRRISVRPTLLVTLTGFVGDVRKVPSTDFPGPGLLVYLLGRTEGALGLSLLERVEGLRFGDPPGIDTAAAVPLYRALARGISGRLVLSCHDLSDGGLAAAAAESCLGGRVGADLVLDALPGAEAAEPVRILFSECPSRLLVSVRAADRERFERSFSGLPHRLLGTTTAEPRLRFRHAGREVLSAALDGLESAYKTPIAGRRYP